MPRPDRRRRSTIAARSSADPEEQRRREAEQRRQKEASRIAQEALKEKLHDRCEAHGLLLTPRRGGLRKVRSNDSKDDQFTLHIPNGKETVEMPLSWDSTAQLRRIVQAASSGLQWLDSYSAFVELDEGYIEAAIKAVSPQEDIPSWVADYTYKIDPELFPVKVEEPQSRSLLHRLRSVREQGRIIANNERLGLSVEISSPSVLASLLRRRLLFVDLLLPYWSDRAHIATLKIRQTGRIRERSDALSLLEAVSRSFSYDLDVTSGGGFQLCLRPPWPPDFDDDPADQRTKPKRTAVRQPLTLTMNDYSPEGLSYYWHARQAKSIPAMEYLNYYQVLEYHFAQYALAEIVEYTRQRLKDPRFDPANSESLARFVSGIDSQMKQNKKELPSLQATLDQCVGQHALVEFMESDDELRDHLAKKNTISGVPQIVASQQDIIKRMAERIYGIRNQLVHAKSENSREGAFILVPGSDEIRHLAQEIKLVRFAAQSVLIASSGSFSA